MPGKIKVLIVDDEPLARDKIRGMLKGKEDIEIVGEAGNGKEAVAAIRKHEPDLLFLDVQMPEMDGFGVLQTIGPNLLPMVVFVTAYDRYALQAFEVYALDYLLKPFDRERFDKALARARSQLDQEKRQDLTQGLQALMDELTRIRQGAPSAKPGPKYLERLAIKASGRIFFLRTQEIDHIESEGNYVRVHAGKESHLIREAMSVLETQLDPKKFLRIHRCTIVNVDRIQELQPWFHGEYRVILRNGVQLTLSRSYREKLREFLGKNL
jgi:two-component system, LytTR family, response regulator